MYLVLTNQPDKGPTPALMEAMGHLAEREIKAGRMIDSGGLLPIAASGAQVSIKSGKLGVTDGPFVETKEVIGGYAIFEMRDMDEAMAGAREFMQLHLEHMPGWEGTCEVRVMATPGMDGACEAGIRAHA
ncbi:MAG: YciI family protein [Bradyrhizobium sp.]